MHGGHGAVRVVRGKGAASVQEVFLRGVWRENPVFRQMLGLCPTLAVTSTVANSLAMGLATFFVLVGSSLLVSTFKRMIPRAVRLSTFIVIIATWVTVADMLLEAVVPDIHKALGPFVYLIVVNCVILARQEAFASRNPVGRAVLDAAGTGLGFILTLLLMGALREVLGYGSFLGVPLFGSSYEPWFIMILPPGGYLAIGIILMGLAWFQGRRAKRGERPGVAPERMRAAKVA